MDNEHLDNEAWASDVLKSAAADKLARELRKIYRDVTVALRHLDPDKLTPEHVSAMPEQVRRIYDTLSPIHDYGQLTKELRTLLQDCGGVLDVIGKRLPSKEEPSDAMPAKMRQRIEAMLPPNPVPPGLLKLIERDCERICGFYEALSEQPRTEAEAGVEAINLTQVFEIAKRSGLFQELPVRLTGPIVRY